MRLSLYQGTSMTMRYAHRKYDPSTLSNVEKNFLINKYKDDANMLERIQKSCALPENKKYKKKKNNKEELKIYNKINQRHETAWYSVQDRSNEIALQCLKNIGKTGK